LILLLLLDRRVEGVPEEALALPGPGRLRKGQCARHPEAEPEQCSPGGVAASTHTLRLLSPTSPCASAMGATSRTNRSALPPKNICRRRRGGKFSPKKNVCRRRPNGERRQKKYMGRYKFAWTGFCKPIVRHLWGVELRVFGQISPATADMRKLEVPHRFRSQVGGAVQKIAFFRFFSRSTVF